MSDTTRQPRWITTRRWIAMLCGVALLVMECYDAIVTPKPDWLWFGVAILQIVICQPRRRRRGEAQSVDPLRAG